MNQQTAAERLVDAGFDDVVIFEDYGYDDALIGLCTGYEV